VITLTFTADTAEDILRDLKAFGQAGLKVTFDAEDGAKVAVVPPKETPAPEPAPAPKPKAEAKPAKAEPEPEPAPAPAADPGLTYDDVREAVLAFVDAKGKEALPELYAPFGVTNAKDLDKALWQELIDACKERMQ
jgi:hypothetical protein